MKGLFPMKQDLFKPWPEYFRSLTLRHLQRLIPLFLVVCMATPSVAAVIDVTTYGAIPNDSADDSLAIQNAIDAAPAGSTIYFPRGTYLLSAVTINNRSDLTLTGDGSTLTILKRNGGYPKMFESSGSTDLTVTNLGFDANGIVAYGGFNFYDAKRITITKNRFFDSNKQPVGQLDRYSWVFGRGSVPSEDIVITDNLIEDLQLEVDFGLRVRIEGNTIVRPVQTAGIGIFTVNDHTSAQDYIIRNNTIADAVVSAGLITVILDPSDNNFCTLQNFQIVGNRILYTIHMTGHGRSAIFLGTGNNGQSTTGNVFNNILIQNNVIYKDPLTYGIAGDADAFFFGNSSDTANFNFDNMSIIDNAIYNKEAWLPTIDIRNHGVNYVERNNSLLTMTTDLLAPSVPTALVVHSSNKQIDLLWNPSVDNAAVSGYRIYRNGSAYAQSTATSYSDSNLLPGTTYTYAVTAIDSNGQESAQSYSTAATALSSPTVTTSSSPTASTSSAGRPPHSSTNGKKKGRI